MRTTTTCVGVAAGLLLALSALAAEPVPIGVGGLPQSANPEAAKIAKELGLNFLNETTRWDEPKEDDYAWTDSPEDPLLARLKALKEQGYTISVTLKNVEDDKKRMPLYLEGRPFDDPKLLQRWAAFLKAFLAQYGDVVDFLNFGHQVNGYFGKHKDEWPGFLKFVAAGAYVVRKEGPKISFGVVLKDTDDPATFWRDLAPACSHLALTYTAPCSALKKQPTTLALNPKHPLFFAKTLDAMLRLAGRRKLLLTEVGCPTHPSLESSPEIQARFLTALFAWLRQAEGRVAALSYVNDKDWPYEATKGLLRQMLGDEILKYRGVIRLLTSRGLRYEDGQKKPGYEAFRKAVEQYRRRR